MCNGQSYDGAGNMAGSIKGAAARIKALYPLATYVHCSSHQLNLSVMKACTIQVALLYIAICACNYILSS